MVLLINSQWQTGVRVLLGGHSYGCPTAVRACVQAPPGLVAGAILHDPAIVEGIAGLDVPAQFVLADGYAANPAIVAGVRATAAASTAATEVLHLVGAEHGNFVDAPLWAALFVMRNLPLIPAAGSADPVALHGAVARAAARLAHPPAPAPAGACAASASRGSLAEADALLLAPLGA